MHSNGPNPHKPQRATATTDALHRHSLPDIRARTCAHAGSADSGARQRGASDWRRLRRECADLKERLLRDGGRACGGAEQADRAAGGRGGRRSRRASRRNVPSATQMSRVAVAVAVDRRQPSSPAASLRRLPAHAGQVPRQAAQAARCSADPHGACLACPASARQCQRCSRAWPSSSTSASPTAGSCSRSSRRSSSTEDRRDQHAPRSGAMRTNQCKFKADQFLAGCSGLEAPGTPPRPYTPGNVDEFFAFLDATVTTTDMGKQPHLPQPRPPRRHVALAEQGDRLRRRSSTLNRTSTWRGRRAGR